MFFTGEQRLRPFALGYVLSRANVLNARSRFIPHGMKQHLKMLDRSVRHHDSMSILEILHLPGCQLDELIVRIEVVRVNPFAHPLESRLGRWIPFKDSKHFVGPADLAGDDIPTKAASK